MTYNVFDGTLNLAQSINFKCYDCVNTEPKYKLHCVLY